VQFPDDGFKICAQVSGAGVQVATGAGVKMQWFSDKHVSDVGAVILVHVDGSTAAVHRPVVTVMERAGPFTSLRISSAVGKAGVTLSVVVVVVIVHTYPYAGRGPLPHMLCPYRHWAISKGSNRLTLA
jgi:hypothetical protein